MVAADTTEDPMKPLTTIELATCTISELLMLCFAIDAKLWPRQNSDRQRDIGFAHRERIRQTLAARARRSR